VPGGAVVATFGLRNVNGVRTTFRALAARVGRDCSATWYRVQLPIRPNGSQGWVRARAVRAYSVDFRVLVDLSDRRLTVFRGDEVYARVATAIGRPETPTPTGSYYVNQRLLAADPTGPWGPGGIGISAFSPVLADWAQGGPIAIHGTNEPWTIGRAASHGCLRIANDVLARLIRLLPDGTPVRIRT
jgi:lipoprotein-anchoring transpeptidase ErfK/SrfK